MNQPASFSFTATVTDKDGDVASDTHTITITDGSGPVGGDTVNLQVDEANLAGGTQAPGNVGDPDTVSVNTTGLSFQAGSDAIADVRFGSTAGI